MDFCKKVMDTLIKDMILLFDASLNIEQVKNVDLEGNLKSVYPSRTDLVLDGVKNIEVVRG